MFGMKQLGINAYANVGLETGVVDASPLKLTVMLYEGAITACIQAQQAMQQQNIAQKGASITKAVSIIDNGLRASLNKGAGGEIANNLDQLYQYMTRSLMQASLHLDANKINEIQHLLMDLKSAWEALEKNALSQSSAQNDVSLANMIGQKTQQLHQMGNINRLAAAGV